MLLEDSVGVRKCSGGLGSIYIYKMFMSSVDPSMLI